MTVFKKVKDLCRVNMTSVGALEKVLEFGHGTIRKWDVQSPTIDKLQKVAAYFNVSLDSFIKDEYETFRERTLELCKKRKITLSDLIDAIPIYPDFLREGEDHILQESEIQTVADYFKVSKDYLKGNVERPRGLIPPPELQELGIEYLETFRYAAASGISPEDIKELIKFAKKQREKSK